MNKTIAAISTPAGVGGIAVIRISGADAVKIAARVYVGKDNLIDAPTHTVHYGFIADETGEKVDEVLVTVMRAPRTFTAEDTVEISTHGGILVTRRVLDAVIAAGAYPAAAGEFTKRAFMNGRIDLSQAEAVIDVITADNMLAGKNAFKQLEGALAKDIREVRGSLVSLLAQMQVAIDYPDEELEDITVADICDAMRAVLVKINTLLAGADNGSIIRNGLKAAIIGKPNVGKSSLLNCLAREERAIVTDVAGTTRDVIEEYVSVNGIPLRLADTAGIRSTDDEVERLGVERSRREIDNAELVIVMLDGADLLTDDDREVLRMTRGKKRIILINKTDLGVSKFIEAVKAKANGAPVLEVSAKTGDGMDAFKDAVREMFDMGEIEQNSGAVVTNARHKSALMEARDALCRGISDLDAGVPQDIVSIEINIACDCLGEITGETVTEDVVESIFHNFCVGK